MYIYFHDQEILVISVLNYLHQFYHYNFILICKSDVLGNVYLPRLKFSLYEGDKNNPIENVYKGLLSFNCIPKRKNTISE